MYEAVGSCTHLPQGQSSPHSGLVRSDGHSLRHGVPVNPWCVTHYEVRRLCNAVTCRAGGFTLGRPGLHDLGSLWVDLAFESSGSARPILVAH